MCGSATLCICCKKALSCSRGPDLRRRGSSSAMLPPMGTGMMAPVRVIHHRLAGGLRPASRFGAGAIAAFGAHALSPRANGFSTGAPFPGGTAPLAAGSGQPARLVPPGMPSRSQPRFRAGRRRRGLDRPSARRRSHHPGEGLATGRQFKTNDLHFPSRLPYTAGLMRYAYASSFSSRFWFYRNR